MSLRSVTVLAHSSEQLVSVWSGLRRMGLPVAWKQHTYEALETAAVQLPGPARDSPPVVLEVIHSPSVSKYRLRNDLARPASIVALNTCPSDVVDVRCLCGPDLPRLAPSWSAAKSLVSLAAGISTSVMMTTTTASKSSTPLPPDTAGSQTPSSSSPSLWVKEVVIGVGDQHGGIESATAQLWEWGFRPLRTALSVFQSPTQSVNIRLTPTWHSAVVLGMDTVDQSQWLARDNVEAYGTRSGDAASTQLRLTDLEGLDVRLCSDPATRAYWNEAPAALEDDTHPDVNVSAGVGGGGAEGDPPSCQAAATRDLLGYVKSRFRETLLKL